jgi:hypothetical protein
MNLASAPANIESRYSVYLELAAHMKDSPHIEARIDELHKELARLGKPDLTNKKGWLSDSPMSCSTKIYFTLDQLAKLNEIGVNTKKSDEITAEIQKGLVKLKNMGILTENQLQEHNNLLKRLPIRKVVSAFLPMFFTSNKN